MASDAGGSKSVAQESPPKRILSFLGLPLETQHEIVSHCSHADLVCLALVNKRCRELAAAQLYRSFHIIFPDEDDVSFDSPVDGLAAGLDTFTTSDYDYAQHLRDLSMDTLSAGIKAEQSYQPFLYNVTCGKILNSLLHLTLSKAKSLETFRWNIRVELSRPVYRQLHRITSLTRLHVRMQAGPSYYSPPPPLPSLAAESPAHGSAHPSSSPPYRNTSAVQPGRHGSEHTMAATFSGFKGLRSLSVLDIESVDVVREIRTCVKNSFSTLKELQLSLSDSYAQRARTPPFDSDVDDSDVDSDFQIVPTSSSPSQDASNDGQVYRAQEERMKQDAVLGKIFDIEPMLIKRCPINGRLQAGRPDGVHAAEMGQTPCPDNPGDAFISSLVDVSAKLMRLQNGSSNVEMDQLETLEVIERAARQYVDSCDLSTWKGKQKTPGDSALHHGEDEPAQQSLDGDVDDRGKAASKCPGGERTQGRQEQVVDTWPAEKASGSKDQTTQVCESLLHQGSAAQVKAQDDKQTSKQMMVAYARDTRGLSLESLSIHLVPVKASVLWRGVDMSCLKQLTLLNVGNQVPVWSMLAKEGRMRPLALRSVFTDHATTTFLSCMAQLPELHELLMLRRSVKHKPESFVPRVTTTIDQIRRLVLKKHMPTLKRLMIKDESSDSNWDANEKAMVIICSRGVVLEELALSMTANTLHTFMQFFSGLANLRAISILRFKNGDTHVLMMREILRFIVDSLTHYPGHKLEWIALHEDHVDRVVRPSDEEEAAAEAQPAKRTKDKAMTPVPHDSPFPPLPMDGLESESDSDDDDDSYHLGPGLRYRIDGPMHFYDVWGVKIFEKEIRSGRL
ncbi:hypothetical protein CP532_1811 [Ophiocordyceps camponoti-leonardi (nom. inval.)]|nr:hypothetical protein CP532_1811 [Ophiocordyceps camponoti-leonardi (nom. inval.)]